MLSKARTKASLREGTPSFAAWQTLCFRGKTALSELVVIAAIAIAVVTLTVLAAAMHVWFTIVMLLASGLIKTRSTCNDTTFSSLSQQDTCAESLITG